MTAEVVAAEPREGTPPRPLPLDRYVAVMVGVAGAVHGIGTAIGEPTAYRAERTLERAVRKLVDGGPIIDLSRGDRNRLLAAIRTAPWLDLSITDEQPRPTRKAAPLSLYVAWWGEAGATIDFKEEAEVAS